MKHTDAFNRFAELYQNALGGSRIGLVLGAGVSYASEVPVYSKFALQAFLSAYDFSGDPGFKEAIKPEIKNYIAAQLNIPAEQREVDPDEVFLLTKCNFHRDLEFEGEKWNRQWTRFCAEELYKDCIQKGYISSTDWRVRKPLYQNNTTLNALITFCAARPQDLKEPWRTLLQSSKGFREVGINPRIGGILTTNYDNLFEAAFNNKYTKSKGDKYGMRPRLEGSTLTTRFDHLPVDHIHGYLSHKINKYVDMADPKKRLVDFVSAETDYFKAFYESMRFGSYTAMSFLESYHILFVGCSMEDENLRRFLFHLKNTSDPHTEKFAMMKNACHIEDHRSADDSKLGDQGHSLVCRARQCLTPRDLYYEEVLGTYGVSVIWYCDYSNIPILLRDIYKKGGDWEDVYKYKRPRKGASTAK